MNFSPETSSLFSLWVCTSELPKIYLNLLNPSAATEAVQQRPIVTSQRDFLLIFWKVLQSEESCKGHEGLPMCIQTALEGTGGKGPKVHWDVLMGQFSAPFTFLKSKSQLHRALAPNIYQHIHDPQHWLFIMQFYFFLCTKTNIKFKSNRKCILAMTSLHYNETGQCDVYWTPH